MRAYTYLLPGAPRGTQSCPSCPGPAIVNPSGAELPEAKLVRLSPDDFRLQTVSAEIRSALPTMRIEKVYAVYNPGLWAAWTMCRSALAKQGRPAESRRLFHATWRANVGSIVRAGFDIRRSGSAHGQMLGAGIYVAETAATAHRYAAEDLSGTKCMIVTRALLGAVAGRAERQASPATVDTYACGDIFAVRREQQIYPEFVVYYADRH